MRHEWILLLALGVGCATPPFTAQDADDRRSLGVMTFNLRFAPLEYDHFWLSDTPERIGSRTWGNRFSRMVTWIRFHDRRTGCQFYVVNTHFDHEVQMARERSAAHRAEPPFGTYHDFDGVTGAADEARIDWILTRGAVTTRSTEIVTFARGDQFPSDHFPVIARVELDDCR